MEELKTVLQAHHPEHGPKEKKVAVLAAIASQLACAPEQLLIQQDAAGDSDRNSVSQTLLEAFINYNLERGWYLISDMIITANWQADSGNHWTVPLGGGFRKMFAIGSQKMNTKLEAYYNVEKPDGAPDWSFSWTLQFLFPR